MLFCIYAILIIAFAFFLGATIRSIWHQPAWFDLLIGVIAIQCSLLALQHTSSIPIFSRLSSIAERLSVGSTTVIRRSLQLSTPEATEARQLIASTLEWFVAIFLVAASVWMILEGAFQAVFGGTGFASLIFRVAMSLLIIAYFRSKPLLSETFVKEILLESKSDSRPAPPTGAESGPNQMLDNAFGPNVALRQLEACTSNIRLMVLARNSGGPPWLPFYLHLRLRCPHF